MESEVGKEERATGAMEKDDLLEFWHTAHQMLREVIVP
jgi:hypothetical protein